MTYATCPDTAIAHKVQITSYEIGLRAELALQLNDLENQRLVAAPAKHEAIDRAIGKLTAIIATI